MFDVRPFYVLFICIFQSDSQKIFSSLVLSRSTKDIQDSHTIYTVPLRTCLHVSPEGTTSSSCSSTSWYNTGRPQIVSGSGKSWKGFAPLRDRNFPRRFVRRVTSGLTGNPFPSVTPSWKDPSTPVVYSRSLGPTLMVTVPVTVSDTNNLQMVVQPFLHEGGSTLGTGE